jgi:hypothetical protein
MVHCEEQALEKKVRVLLEKNGWMDPEIKRVKRLDDPFRSEDPDMLACYAGAVTTIRELKPRTGFATIFVPHSLLAESRCPCKSERRFQPMCRA